MKPIKLAANTVCVLVLGLGFLTAFKGDVLEVSEDYVEFRLGHYNLEIPRKNVISNSIPSWLRWLPGLDDGSNSALFLFKDREIKGSIPGYKYTKFSFRDDIEILAMILTPEEINRYKNPETYSQLGDLWRNEGSYSDRKVEHYGSNGWYKVYRAIEYPHSWALLNRYPETENPLPESTLEFWVAHCLEFHPNDGKHVSCTSHVLFDDILIEFDISEYNIVVINEIRNYLQITVKNWIKEDHRNL